MRLLHVVMVLLVIFAAILSAGQQIPAPSPPAPCIEPNEPIYTPGKDGVVPGGPGPQFDKEGKKALLTRGTFYFGIVVNSEGRVCEVQVLKATDQASAKAFARAVLEHSTFKRAMRKGKPVAVKFFLTFNRPE